jgi:hypothetical protein
MKSYMGSETNKYNWRAPPCTDTIGHLVETAAIIRILMRIPSGDQTWHNLLLGNHL